MTTKKTKKQAWHLVAIAGSLALAMGLSGCSKEQLQRAGADWLRSACSDLSKCTYRCPDGSETDPDFPRCDGR